MKDQDKQGFDISIKIDQDELNDLFQETINNKKCKLFTHSGDEMIFIHTKKHVNCILKIKLDDFGSLPNPQMQVRGRFKVNFCPVCGEKA